LDITLQFNEIRVYTVQAGYTYMHTNFKKLFTASLHPLNAHNNFCPDSYAKDKIPVVNNIVMFRWKEISIY